MHRSPAALCVACLAALHPLAASQGVETLRVSTSGSVDVHQETLQDINPGSRQVREVFPGSYVSPYGASVVKRLEGLMGRVDEATRNLLVRQRVGAGFDRSIISWRAHPAGRIVALAVRYYRQRLFQLDLEVTDDYGRSDPVDPARFEFITIAVCSRTDADGWTCGEEQLADVAGRHNVTLPQDRAERLAAAEKLVEMVLAGK